jgi:hypothetical protein
MPSYRKIGWKRKTGKHIRVNLHPSALLKKTSLRTLYMLFICLLCGCTKCTERELGVYTLCSYENGWKGNVCVNSAYDPYCDFWNIMTSGSGSPYADTDNSQQFLNSEVNIQSVIPIPGDGIKSWDEFDLVFFYGHNNTIVPPHPHDSFGYYNYEGGVWVHKSGFLDEILWGDTTNYDYYAIRPIDYADQYPGALTYLYYEYTSSLLGGLYDYGGGGHHWRLHWNDPLEYLVYGQLGDIDLEWLILHGCQAVITANMDGSYNSLGLSCFHWVQGKFHIVMGHYKSYYCSQMQPLASFAYDLMDSVPIQTAYFDTDPDWNTSAIAAEKFPFEGWANSTMVNDKWDAAVDDYEDTSIFTQRWIVSLGIISSHWD